MLQRVYDCNIFQNKIIWTIPITLNTQPQLLQVALKNTWGNTVDFTHILSRVILTAVLLYEEIITSAILIMYVNLHHWKFSSIAEVCLNP